jgi:hypothetical protein
MVQAEEAGRLQLAHYGWSVLFISHPRMQRRQHRKRHCENKNTMDETDSSAEPPSGHLQCLKGCNVNEREDPAVYEMQKKAMNFALSRLGVKQQSQSSEPCFEINSAERPSPMIA